jgi:hypothetical protein
MGSAGEGLGWILLRAMGFGSAGLVLTALPPTNPVPNYLSSLFNSRIDQEFPAFHSSSISVRKNIPN